MLSSSPLNTETEKASSELLNPLTLGLFGRALGSLAWSSESSGVQDTGLYRA